VGLAHHVAQLKPARPGDEEAVERWDWFQHRHFLELIEAHYDFLGINYYTRIFVGNTRLPFAPMGVLPGFAEVERALTPFIFRLLGGRRDGRPRTGMGWEVVPEGLEEVLLRYHRLCGKPLYVTENGMAATAGLSRAEFLSSHLASVGRAVAQGADVRGYFHWSLMDNYEWGSYRPRFGLFTRDRRPSEGSEFYAEVAGKGAFPDG
jgi:beta-glucosidase/6-phospho-beta-glucosidase/beta-galactosidase